MRRVWVIVLLLLWLSASVGVVQGAPAVTAPGRIVFVRGDSLRLWEAGQERQLFQGHDLSAPRFSADGRYIAFQRDLSEYVISADGSGPWAVPGRAPKWSPTGNLLALDTTAGVTVLPITEQGPGKAQLTVDGWHDAAWSPDGRTLALARVERGMAPLTGTSTIGLMTLAEREPRVLWQERFAANDLYGSAGQLRWSPDGRWLSYLRFGFSASAMSDTNQLVVLPVAGGTPVPVGETVPNAAFYAWSPSGSSLAFTDGAGRLVWHNKQVRVAPMPPKPPFQSLTPEGYADREPAWHPSGNYLALSRSLARSPERTNRTAAEQAIWVIPIASGAGHPIPGSGGGVGPSWGPDGSLLWVQPPVGDKPASLWWKPGAEVGQARELIPEVALRYEYYGQWRWADVFDWWIPGKRKTERLPSIEREALALRYRGRSIFVVHRSSTPPSLHLEEAPSDATGRSRRSVAGAL